MLIKEGDICLGRIYAINYKKNGDDKKSKYKRIFYNYPQKLDRAIRCMIACKNIEEARQNAQFAEAT